MDSNPNSVHENTCPDFLPSLRFARARADKRNCTTTVVRLRYSALLDLRHAFDISSNVWCISCSLESILYIDCIEPSSATTWPPLAPCEASASVVGCLLIRAHSMALFRSCTCCKSRGVSAKACRIAVQQNGNIPSICTEPKPSPALRSMGLWLGFAGPRTSSASIHHHG